MDKAAKARGIRSDGVAEHRNEKNSVLFRKHLTGEEVGGGSVTTKEALCSAKRSSQDTSTESTGKTERETE